jgi:hypothetical protein
VADVKSTDPRDRFIGRVVGGCTFADVGGLWGGVNERASVAHRLGARSVAMIDLPDLGDGLWLSFRERMRELGVENYATLETDIAMFEPVDETQIFDVVHSSGLLYHHPSPLVVLERLAAITRGHLILTSAVIPPHIENDVGRLEVPSSGVIFVPALSNGERQVLAASRDFGGGIAFGLTHPCSFRLDDFGPWWWLPTPVSLAAMCEIAGYEVLEAANLGAGFLTLLLRRRADLSAGVDTSRLAGIADRLGACGLTDGSSPAKGSATSRRGWRSRILRRWSPA